MQVNLSINLIFNPKKKRLRLQQRFSISELGIGMGTEKTVPRRAINKKTKTKVRERERKQEERREKIKEMRDEREDLREEWREKRVERRDKKGREKTKVYQIVK